MTPAGNGGAYFLQSKNCHELHINSLLELRVVAHDMRARQGLLPVAVSFLLYTLALERLGQGGDLALCFVGPLLAFVNPVARLIAEVIHGVTRVFVLAAKGLAHLLSGL